MKIIYIMSFFLIFITNILFAQTKRASFDRLTTKDGLSQNRIFCIAQDKLGFIWIGTEDGLNRYDGYKFKIYKNIPGDSTSLVSNFINAIYVSKKGDLWLGGNLGGLSKFNYDTESFDNYRNDHSNPNSISGNWVIGIDEDSRGNLWVETLRNGFNYFDIHNKKFYHMENLVPPGYYVNDENFTFIHQDKTKHLWVGGSDKLYRFSMSYLKGEIPRLQPLKFNDKKNNLIATAINEDYKGNIWIGLANKGLYSYDSKQNVLKSYVINNYHNQVDNSIITSIVSDKEDNLWLGGFLSNGESMDQVNGIGLYKINLPTKNINSYTLNRQDVTSISSNAILSLFKDRTGTLWIGTGLAGLNKYDESVIKFPVVKSNNLNSIISVGLSAAGIRGFYEKDNVLWIASAQGLISYNKISKKYRYYTHDPNDKSSISSNVVRCIYDDGKYLWIGTDNALNRFDIKTKKFRSFYLDPYLVQTDRPGMNSVNYNILEIDKMPGYLWYGSSGAGLVRFNKNNFTFKNYTYDPETLNSLNDRGNFVRTVWYSDSRPDELWLGTTHGINILNLRTEKFRYYQYNPQDTNTLSHNNVMHFYEDKKGYIWISTYGGGLNRFDPKTENFKRFTEDNSGIPNNGVYGVLPDKKGNLWMSTNKGISCLNPKTLQFRNYTVDDGLQSEEFNGGAYYLSKNGEMYFGGINGYNVFKPEDIVDNKLIPEMAITDIKIFNQSLKIGVDSPLKQQISNTEDITLPYWQNDISFEFVALHYANPAKNRYAYKLENYENDWRYVGHIRTATYTNLDPGKYIFHVKGSNNDGLWNEKGKSLTLIIMPPWWKTNLAYTGYFLFLLLCVFVIDRIQRRRLLAKERAASSIKEAELRAQLAESESERKTKELEEARQLQLSMLPKDLPSLPHLDIAVYMKTATEVGGDYYDFHVGLDGTLTVVVGDATGHGMKAGTMVTSTKSLFNTLAPNPDIIETFHEMTRCLKLMHMKKLSMCMTMLKIMGNKIQMSSAGMPPVFLYQRENQAVEELVMKGMPLGTFNNFPYVLKNRDLNSGDTILLVSDGLPELFNENKEMFGYKRMKNIFEESADKPPEEIIRDLKDAGSDWAKEKDPDDDVTFVVIKVK